ncbi:MAG: serine hydrolase [Oscillatoria sp. PMC 1068.18]|nr:serine hydrolase [Oscillatoria sp. PMC 1076.18]MEC4990152.1 serine hydrolase [Oscillatoria sp. PMC 1068.18]
MKQQEKLDWYSPYEEITDLRSELDRAYLSLYQLRQENIQLRQEITYLKQNSPQQLTKRSTQLRKKTKPKRRSRSKINSKQVQFYLNLGQIFLQGGWLVSYGIIKLIIVSLRFCLLFLFKVVELIIVILRALWWIFAQIVLSLIFPVQTEKKANLASVAVDGSTQSTTNNYSSSASRQKAKDSAQEIAKKITAILALLVAIATLAILPKLERNLVPPNLAPSSQPTPKLRLENGELVYNSTVAPNFKSSQQLQTIVEGVVNLAARKKFSQANLSVTLINVNSGEIAGSQETQSRYPASVVKLFWLVAVYGQIEAGLLTPEQQLMTDVKKMITESENDAASRIVDAITNTEPGGNLAGEEYQVWLKKRTQINRFFQNADYKNLDIAHKTYPILSLNQQKPTGREQQMRQTANGVLRNLITTKQAARLMYEIVTRRAISPRASEEMMSLLARDLNPQVWRNMEAAPGVFNPVRGFFGESLPQDVYFFSKAGWTSTGRHEVAFVSTKDGKTAYILAVFASDRAYAQNWNIFPQMSRLVFEEMTQVSSQ